MKICKSIIEFFDNSTVFTDGTAQIDFMWPSVIIVEYGPKTVFSHPKC